MKANACHPVVDVLISIINREVLLNTELSLIVVQSRYVNADHWRNKCVSFFVKRWIQILVTSSVSNNLGLKNAPYLTFLLRQEEWWVDFPDLFDGTALEITVFHVSVNASSFTQRSVRFALLQLFDSLVTVLFGLLIVVLSQSAIVSNVSRWTTMLGAWE